MQKLSMVLAALTLLTSAAGANAATPSIQSIVTNPDRTMTAAQCALPGDNASLWKDNIALADRLNDKGIKFDWMARSGNCLDVAVIAPNGTVSREVYDPNTLHRALRSSKGTESAETAESDEGSVIL